jgi:hypothetical protein
MCTGGTKLFKEAFFRRDITGLGSEAVSTLRNAECFREFLIWNGDPRELLNADTE